MDKDKVRTEGYETSECENCEAEVETEAKDTNNQENEELQSLKALLDDRSKQCDEYKNMLQRIAAEFDNYKKRTAREKDSLYSEAVSDTISAFLPVVDNIERAIKACEMENTQEAMVEGVEMINKQVMETLSKLEVEQIDCIGKNFDPNLHNAVMHVEDDSFGQNVVIEEFQKGYIYKDKVIRHSVVKVAN